MRQLLKKLCNFLCFLVRIRNFKLSIQKLQQHQVAVWCDYSLNLSQFSGETQASIWKLLYSRIGWLLSVVAKQVVRQVTTLSNKVGKLIKIKWYYCAVHNAHAPFCMIKSNYFCMTTKCPIMLPKSLKNGPKLCNVGKNYWFMWSNQMQVKKSKMYLELELGFWKNYENKTCKVAYSRFTRPWLYEKWFIHHDHGW